MSDANGAAMFCAIFGWGESDTADFKEKFGGIVEAVFLFFANASAANSTDYIPMRLSENRDMASGLRAASRV